MKFGFRKRDGEGWHETSDDSGGWANFRVIVPYLRLRIAGGWFNGTTAKQIFEELKEEDKRNEIQF